MSDGRDHQLATSTLVTYCACLFLAGSFSNAQTAAEPRRIVSINVCTDQLLMTLVDRERIASLSHLAVDPYSSWIGEGAEGLHLNHGSAEEVIALNPDLVVSATFSFRPTVAILKRLGYPVVELRMASSLDDIATNLRILAAAVGEAAQADSLISDFRSEIERQAYRGPGPQPLFVSYEADGWTPGQHSLVADVARIAGFQTVGDRLGHTGGRRISLEQLLVLEPELMDLGHRWDAPPALASESFRHPALKALLETTTLVDISDPLWLCGSTRTLQALNILRRARDDLPARNDVIEP